MRWAAVEAVQRVSARTRLGQVRDRVAERRGRNIGVVAAARELVTLVFYGLRDHHIRALDTTAAPWQAARRHETAAASVVGAGRAGHDPRLQTAWSSPLIDPVHQQPCRNTPCRHGPTPAAAKG